MFRKLLILSVLLIGTFTVRINAAPPTNVDLRNVNKNVVDDIATYSEILRVQEATKKVEDSPKKTRKVPRKKIILEHLPTKLDSPDVFKPVEKTFDVYNNHLIVTATAYTSHVDQTDDTPNIAAWGDRLSEGMKAIAVSRDLLDVYGMTRGTKVKIKGMPDEYLVLDKMNKRWKKKIDVYMGMDKSKAFAWGSRKVQINWD